MLEICQSGAMQQSLSYCLTHQLPETGTSPLGGVCRCCKSLVYLQANTNVQGAYWESQPAAYTLDRQPIFVYVRILDGIKLRSLREEAVPLHS